MNNTLANSVSFTTRSYSRCSDFVIILCVYTHTYTELTCADSDGLNKLFPPGVCADHQRQVGLLNELVDGALPIRSTAHSISNQ